MKIQINPDKEKVQMAREALAKNDWYCPCALEKNSSTKCMCKDFINKAERGYVGECNCGLYISVNEG